jgi:hypothetical protein
MLHCFLLGPAACHAIASVSSFSLQLQASDNVDARLKEADERAELAAAEASAALEAALTEVGLDLQSCSPCQAGACMIPG